MGIDEDTDEVDCGVYMGYDIILLTVNQSMKCACGSEAEIDPKTRSFPMTDHFSAKVPDNIDLSGWTWEP